MNRITIYALAALTICSLLLLPASSSGLTTSNVTLSASGVVQYNNLSVNKAVTAFGVWFTDTDTSFVANHFTFLTTDFDGSRTDFYIPFLPAMQSIKTKNPNVKIIGYKELIGIYDYNDDWAEVNSHEDWFIHDANGNRIVNSQYGWYLMDVGSQGWRQHWVSYVNSKMTNTPYDGVFADDVWTEIWSWYLAALDHTVKDSDVSRWHADTAGMLQYVKANMLPGKILVINTDEGILWQSDTHDYRDIADGYMIEGYFHAVWEDPTTYHSDYNINRQIDALASDSAAGKIVLAASGTLTSDSETTNRLVKACYVMFLLGVNGPQAYWSFNESPVGWYVLDGNYQPIMDTDIGQPTGAYYISQNVYMRDFTGGKALFNPSASSYTVNLGGTYKLLDGATVSSVTLNSYSGEILLSPT